MATWGDVIESALKEINILAEGETASAAMSADGLTRVNRFIDRLATENLTPHTLTRTTWTITASDGSYTIGSGADISVARPTIPQIESVGFIDTSTDPDTEYPLDHLTDDAYQAISLKAQTATFPQAWWYNPTYANGTLELWPVPTSSTLSGVIYIRTALTQASALSTTVSLPPGYEEMFVTNLALILCPAYGVQPNPILVKLAGDTMAAVKRANKRLVNMKFEAAALIGDSSGYTYDIREG